MSSSYFYFCNFNKHDKYISFSLFNHKIKESLELSYISWYESEHITIEWLIKYIKNNKRQTTLIGLDEFIDTLNPITQEYFKLNMI